MCSAFFLARSSVCFCSRLSLPGTARLCSNLRCNRMISADSREERIEGHRLSCFRFVCLLSYLGPCTVATCRNRCRQCGESAVTRRTANCWIRGVESPTLPVAPVERLQPSHERCRRHDNACTSLKLFPFLPFFGLAQAGVTTEAQSIISGLFLISRAFRCCRSFGWQCQYSARVQLVLNRDPEINSITLPV